MEQTIMLDKGIHEGRRRLMRFPVEMEVEGTNNKQQEHLLLHQGHGQAHRLGKTKPGKMRSFLRTVEKFKAQYGNHHHHHHRHIEDIQLGYISAVLNSALRKGTLLVRQRELALLERPRKSHQAQFIRKGIRRTEREKSKKDKYIDRMNDSRVAKNWFGVQVNNSESRSHRKHERMRRGSQSDTESSGSWETASSVDFSPSSIHRKRHGSSGHHSDDGYSSRYDEDGYSSSDDDDDTRSQASTVFSRSSRASSRSSSSGSSRSKRSNSRHGSGHNKSGEYAETMEQFQRPPEHPPHWKHGYGYIPPEDIPPENLPYPHEPYPGKYRGHAQPYATGPPVY